MTSEELMPAVNVYFHIHLDSKFWEALPEDTRAGAVSMAAQDILAELPGVSLDAVTQTSYTLRAIAEQAAFLVRNYEELSGGKLITGEGLDGISTSYTPIGKPGLCLRAMRFIEKERRRNIGASARVSRG